MVLARILLVSWLAVAGPAAAKEGFIAGTVVNASRGRTPEAGSEVVLRIRLSGQFVPFDQTKTDAQGRFRFGHVPLGRSYVYQPGANRDGVHYPGPALEITPERPSAFVELAVCDAVAEPCPLVIRRQEIAMRHEPGALYVTESILVDNPTATCYVGRAGEEGSQPITLQMAIPSEFTRVTFHEEFYGRRFGIADGKLVTGIPWPPGRRELAFTYVVPTKAASYRWQRPLDLPCDVVRVRVEDAGPGEVACNLDRGPDEKAGAVTFASEGSALPAGHTVCVELGRLSVPLIASARWLALAILGLLAAGAGGILLRKRGLAPSPRCVRMPRRPPTATVPVPFSEPGPQPSASRRAA